MSPKQRISLKITRAIGRRVAIAATLVGAAGAAHATDYSEGAITVGPNGLTEVHDLSSTGSSPTNIGTLTAGSNIITGATIPYGRVTNAMTGERQYQDNDYLTFTVPTGYVLSNLYLVAPNLQGPGPNGTVILPGDQFFMGIASGTSVNVTPPSSAGLLGYTLLSSSQVGTDILPALGASSPPGFSGPPFSGATTFTAPLAAGSYSLWLLDGDNPVLYDLNLQTAAVPELASWMMMLGGVGLIGVGLRRRATVASRVIA